MANTKKTTTTKKPSTKKEENIETPKVDDEVKDVEKDKVLTPEAHVEVPETVNAPEQDETEETEVEKTSISAEELKTVDLDELKGNNMHEDLIPTVEEKSEPEQKKNVIKATPLFPKSKYTQSMIVKKYN